MIDKNTYGSEADYINFTENAPAPTKQQLELAEKWISERVKFVGLPSADKPEGSA